MVEWFKPRDEPVRCLGGGFRNIFHGWAFVPRERSVQCLATVGLDLAKAPHRSFPRLELLDCEIFSQRLKSEVSKATTKALHRFIPRLDHEICFRSHHQGTAQVHPSA